MDNAESTDYIRCFTCGRYFPKQEAMEGKFCSLDCMKGYRQCPSCRDFFPVEEDRFDGYCSIPCKTAAEEKKRL